MPYIIYVTPTAIRDLSSATEYYNAVSPDLGYRFADIIAEYFERIALLPTATAIRYKNVRCKPVRKFPYIITYTVDDATNTVQVPRIFNTYLDPRRI
jgi:toxin ParE1/3/4